MQIQRLQNLYLLIAFVCAILSLNFPWLRMGADATMSVQNNIPLLILGLLATILPLLGLALYKNLSRQKLVARLSALFAVVSLGYVVALAYLGGSPDAEVCLAAPVNMAISGIFDALAARAIAHDQQLLKAADRIR